MLAFLESSISMRAIESTEVFVDDSQHKEYGFTVLAYLIECNSDHTYLNDILAVAKLPEYHSYLKFDRSKELQSIRSKLTSYINFNCRWGILIAPFEEVQNFGVRTDLITAACKNYFRTNCRIYLDLGLKVSRNCGDSNSTREECVIEGCDSRSVLGIQLADIVANNASLRMKERLGGRVKMLTYGQEAGFDPPITTNLGYELWASLRYSMMKDPITISNDEEIELTRNTLGYGLILSSNCNDQIKSAATSEFGQCYVGCIH